MSERDRHRAVNACLLPIAYAHHAAVTTVEGLGSTRTGLHPVQERMALYAGSQCGFCTPGFVMSLSSKLRDHNERAAGTPVHSHELIKCMDGNLCRCTGYRPIVDAAKTVRLPLV